LATFLSWGSIAKIVDLAGVFFFMIWLQFEKSDEKQKDIGPHL
jgi:hypothetical protein